MGPSRAKYDAALDAVTADYRALKVGDAEFLASRARMAEADAAFETAFREYVEPAEAAPEEAETPEPDPQTKFAW